MTVSSDPIFAGSRPAASRSSPKRETFKRILFRVSFLWVLLRRPLYWLLRIRGLTREELATDTKYHPRSFGSAETITLKEPQTRGEHPAALEKDFSVPPIVISNSFVCEVPEVRLCGPQAVGFDAHRNVILETTTPIYRKRGHLATNVSLRCLREYFRKSQSIPEVELATSLVNEWSANYWHWLVDSLPRLEGVEHYAAQTGTRPKLIIHRSPSAMQWATLRLMGYGEDDCIPWNRQRMLIKKLLVSPFRRQFQDGVYGIPSPRAIRWVADRIIQNLPPSPSDDGSPAVKRIYISRRLTAARRVVNEEELLAALEPHGFTSYCLENLPFVEQVRLFSQAEVVLAPHGAGLSNMIFGRNLTVIELFGRVCPRCYSVTSRALDFRYGYLRFPQRLGGFRGQDADFVANVPAVLKFIGELARHPVPFGSEPIPRS